jgi:arginyl-tRNA synthetase
MNRMAGLSALVDAALAPAFAALKAGAPSALRASQRADFQVDGVLGLAKALGRPPREVAAEIVTRASALGLADMCDKIEVAGPGFINLTLSGELLAAQCRALAKSGDRLGVERASPAKKVVVDYGGPNAAKQMHVGHLRSAIIGDAIVRALEFVGHDVVRENHVGDWGAPFGMLIEHLVDLGEEKAAHELAVGDLESFYQASRSAYESDPGFADRARARVVLLQSGDPATVQLWEALVQRSTAHFDDAFRRLGTKLTADDVVGESFYRPMLPGVVADLERAGLLVESDGARCVFPPGFTNREGEPLPLIVQNSVGGYTYAATDLAAIKDRAERLKAELVVYVVGLPQAQHFKMLFATAEMAGWLGAGREAVHVAFGNVLGSDGRMFRTRQGGTVKLSELLDEAVARASELLLSRPEGQGQPPAGELGRIAHAVGVGAVKYADLSTDRVRDYRFDWDRMLSFDGNTAPYIQYANARIRSVGRKAGEDLGPGSLARWAEHVAPPGTGEERELAKCLGSFPDAVAASLDGWYPHRLCGYLFDLAGAFTDFYERCPVLRAGPDRTRAARLALCALTSAVLEKGLSLLGIEALERM